MFCPKCGTQNENAARFCKSCGADLSVSSLYGVTGEHASAPSKTMNLSDAIYRVLQTKGLGILNDPKLLLAMTSDFCEQGSAEFRLFEYNCDRELLEYFSGLSARTTDEAALDDAANRAYMLLCARSSEATVAEEMTRCLRNAIARHLGLPEVARSTHPLDEGTGQWATDTGYTTRMTPAETNLLPRQGVTVHVDNDTSGMDRMPDGYFSDGGNVAPAMAGGTPNATAPVAPVYAPPVSPEPPRAGVSKPLIALLIALIFVIGGVSYALFMSDSGTGGESSASSSTPTNTTESGTATAEVETYTIKYRKGSSDATGSMDEDTVEPGNKVKLPSCAFKRSGYTFDGWLGEDDKEYSVGDRVTINEDTAFTAIWKKDKSEEEPSAPSTPSAPSAPTVTPKTLPSNPSMANSFPLKWAGTYTGFTDDVAIERQLLFEFSRPSDTGDLTGICYVGVSQTGSGALYGDYYVSGTVNWDTGAIHLVGTSWIDQGGLGDLREYDGTVNFSGQSMSGSCYDVGTNDYKSNWQVYATNTLNWNTNTGKQVEAPEPKPAPENPDDNDDDDDDDDDDDGFPAAWTGTYDGWTSRGATGDDTISRSVSFYFDTIEANGDLAGYCYVGVDEDSGGATQAAYYVFGHVDWDTGDIHIEGTSWIEHGTLTELRQYDGTVDFVDNTISGTASDVGTGDYPGDFSLHAV